MSSDYVVIPFSDVVFTEGQNLEVVDGKPKWPTLIQVRVKRERALSLAIGILSNLDSSALHGNSDPYVTLSLAGELEQMPDE